MTQSSVTRTIITHVGTSVFDRIDEQRLQLAKTIEQYRSRQQSVPASICEQVAEQLADRLRIIWKDYPVDPTEPEQITENAIFRRRKAPAEIASLDLLGLRANDRIVLACSDTDDGASAAGIVYHTLCRFYPDLTLAKQLTQTRLHGIETKEGHRFVSEGLPNYVKCIGEEAQRLLQIVATARKLIFNITGGYKGVIPFATLAAQLISTRPNSRIATEMVYVHDQADALIAVEPLVPVDWPALDSLYPSLRTIVEAPCSPAARSYCQNPALAAYCAGCRPNALAETIVRLYQVMAWAV